MVCYSAAVLTKGGKVLLARQFVEMSRMRIENHLATFPKLVGTEKQHNTVETAEVRYVYRPVESLLLVLVTNKHSNIVDDLEMLRLFARVLSEYCPGDVDEHSVCKNAFELAFAFDEVVSMGHKENVSLRDIQVHMEMESHEEKLATMIRLSKEREAQETMKLKARSIARESRGSSKTGMGSSSASFSSPSDLIPSVGGFGADTSSHETSMGSSFGSSLASSFERPSYAKPIKKGTGMQLGKPKEGANANLLQAMAEEGEVLGADVGMPQSAPQARTSSGQPQAGIQLTIDEKIVVTMSRDGGLQGMEVKGDLQLLITDPAYGKASLPLKLGENAGFQFKTHPNINKQLFGAEQCLALRDTGRPFPTGSSLGVLKWRLQTTDDSHAPLLINCWPTQTADGAFEVNVEYELNGGRELRDVRIVIPLPEQPQSVSPAEAGEAAYSKRDNALIWTVPIIDESNASASVEFTAHAGADAFFPIQVFFTSPRTFCEIDVPEVRNAEDGVPLPFGKTAGLSVEQYNIV